MGHGHRWIVAAVGVSGSVLLAACGGGAHTGSPNTTLTSVTATNTISSSPTTSSATTAPASASPSVTAAQDACSPTTLHISLESKQGAGGTGYYMFAATNRGTQSCQAGGYFGVALYDQAGHLLSANPQRDPSSPTGATVQQVAIGPGATATFTVEIGENAATKCAVIGSFHFIPPNAIAEEQVSVPASANYTFCDTSFYIDPTSGLGVPTLGRPTNTFDGHGFGLVEPSSIDNGGDPTGAVSQIVWSSWGEAEAIGTGQAEWVGPNQDVAQGTQQRADIVAFNLGTCDGQYMYQAVEWYFPQHGESFNPATYEDICDGSYVGSP
jgi:hypothetical protein